MSNGNGKTQQLIHPAELSFQDGIRFCVAHGWDFSGNDTRSILNAIQAINRCEAQHSVPDRVMVLRSGTPQNWREEYDRIQQYWARDMKPWSSKPPPEQEAGHAGRPAGRTESKPVVRR